MHNSQSLSKGNLSTDSWDIQHSREKRKETLSSEKIAGLCEEYFIETQDSLNAIIDDKLEQWRKHLDEDKKLIDEGRKYQDNLPQNSATNWQMTMQNSFANHHAQKNPSTSQLDHEALGNRALQYLVETPSSVSDLDGFRDYSDMPARRLDFTPAKSVPFATRLV
jgi:cellobiose-specific phosphotransferase system component IIA